MPAMAPPEIDDGPAVAETADVWAAGTAAAALAVVLVEADVATDVAGLVVARVADVVGDGVEGGGCWMVAMLVVVDGVDGVLAVVAGSAKVVADGRKLLGVKVTKPPAGPEKVGDAVTNT